MSFNLNPVPLASAASAARELQAAVDRGDSDLLPLLHPALLDLVRNCSTAKGCNAEHELSAIERTLPALKVVANAPTDGEDAADDIQNHILAISAILELLWDAITGNTQTEQNESLPQPTQSNEVIDNLLIALALLLQVFEVDDRVAVKDRMAIVSQRLSQRRSDGPVSNNWNMNVITGGGSAVNKNWVFNCIYPERTVPGLAKQHEKTIKAIKNAIGDRFVYEALYDTQPKDAGCMPGTRETILSKFVDWVKCDPKRIFWLAGLAGTGKTSIAVTLCRMLYEDPSFILGGAFFCSRSVGCTPRTEVRRILPTLAMSLAAQSPVYASTLAAELKKDDRVIQKPVADQMDSFIVKPLAALVSTTRPIVFVIDALDECSDERELADLLAQIATISCEASAKFILTSRPETHILGSPISDQTQNEILQLHMTDTAEVTADIHRYINDAFSKQPLTRPWYSDVDVVQLAALAEGLFIFASTIVSYILKVQSVKGRVTRLRTVLSAVRDSKVALGRLNTIYELVLTRASDSTAVESKELEAALQALAGIITARMSLSVGALADLLDREVDELRESLGRLHAVVHVPRRTYQPGLRILHASFSDYLFSRSVGELHVTMPLGHDILARGCLQRMAQPDLRFNVSSSRSSYEQNDRNTPPSLALSLVYACMYWAHHINAASEPSVYDSEIARLFVPKFLFWLEVLSVLKKVAAASGLLRIAELVVRRDDVSKFLRDASNFVASSHDAIELSAPHIYLSALPFAAKDSLVYKIFSPLFSGPVQVETFGVNHHGSRLVMTLTGHEDTVSSMAYFPDGRVIVSGSLDGTVRFWDVLTAPWAAVVDELPSL